MIIAELPVNEELRLLDLASYNLLDTQPESEFDDLVELAGQICNCPASLITLLDKERQWFKAKKGIDASETPRDIAFCSHTILPDEVMIVEDATKDIRFSDNPFVVGELNVRFYAGAPIYSTSGFKLGTICVIDKVPKKLTKEQEVALKIISKQITKLLELRKKNAQIRKSAEEIISIKSKNLDKVITQQEDEKKAIAANLHEEIAQGIASSLLYLKVAEEIDEERIPLIKSTSKLLNEILSNVKNLSYNITPYYTHWVSIEELIQEYIEKVKDTFPFLMELECVSEKNNTPSDNAIVAIRIIENWLKVLALKNEIKKVKFTLQSEKDFIIVIEDDGPLVSFENQRKTIFDSLIYDIAHLKDGAIDVSNSPMGGNLVKVVLPIPS